MWRITNKLKQAGAVAALLLTVFLMPACGKMSQASAEAIIPPESQTYTYNKTEAPAAFDVNDKRALQLALPGNFVKIVIEFGGALVTKTEDNATKLKVGDVIEAINGRETPDLDTFAMVGRNALASDDSMILTIRRDDKKIDIQVSEYELKHSSVKFNNSSHGTISSYNPETGVFTGLAHELGDDTFDDYGKFFKSGYIEESNVIGFNRPTKTSAGSVIPEDTGEVLGTITSVNINGIVGEILPGKTFGSIPIGKKEDLHTGPAKLICETPDGRRAFDVEITAININAEIQAITLKVTDPELIGIAGGLVEGVSGGSLCQDGEVRGAVSHAVLGAPTQGRGQFIDNMVPR